MTDSAMVYRFEARCKVCRRKLGEVEVPREHGACDVVFTTTCRTRECRGRIIPIRFDKDITATARGTGY